MLLLMKISNEIFIIKIQYRSLKLLQISKKKRSEPTSNFYYKVTDTIWLKLKKGKRSSKKSHIYFKIVHGQVLYCHHTSSANVQWERNPNSYFGFLIVFILGSPPFCQGYQCIKKVPNQNLLGHHLKKKSTPHTY